MAAMPPGFRVLKRRFDPDGVFASAIPLPVG
jgi:FAD/FMN-containing dehydrogenase